MSLELPQFMSFYRNQYLIVKYILPTKNFNGKFSKYNSCDAIYKQSIHFPRNVFNLTYVTVLCLKLWNWITGQGVNTCSVRLERGCSEMEKLEGKLFFPRENFPFPRSDSCLAKQSEGRQSRSRKRKALEEKKGAWEFFHFRT